MRPLSLKRTVIFCGILLLTASAVHFGARSLREARSAPTLSILHSYRAAMSAVYKEMGSYPSRLDQIAYKAELPGYTMHSSQDSIPISLQIHLQEAPLLKTDSYFLILEVRDGDQAELWGIRDNQEPFRIFP